MGPLTGLGGPVTRPTGPATRPAGPLKKFTGPLVPRAGRIAAMASAPRSSPKFPLDPHVTSGSIVSSVAGWTGWKGDLRMRPPPWKVGELAKRTGVSVRALHHYDEIGLLSASLRSESGYRLYTEADVIRLQQIRSLRSLGFSLDESRE